MLKKDYRLKVLKKNNGAKTISTFFFTLRFWENGESLSKFAFIISKKINKKAVIRNKIKRSLARVLKEILTEIKPGYSFVFIVKKEILEKSQKEIEKNLKETFKINNLLK